MNRLKQRNKPLVIAHRGASGYLPEHTLEAKVMAYAQGADYLEQDLVLSKDGVPVVLHDVHIDTVTDVARRFPSRKRADGRYYALDFTVEELKQLRVSERFNPTNNKAIFAKRFPVMQSQFTLPTLEEELQLVQGLNKSTGRTVGIYPELKNPAWHRAQGHDLSKAVVPILQRYGYDTQSGACFIQCFEYPEVKRLRTELGWKGRLVMLLSLGRGEDGTDFSALQTPKGLTELAPLVQGIGPDLSSVIANGKVTELVKNAHAAGLAVHPYTFRTDALPRYARTPDDLLRLLFTEAKIDGLFTDFTDTVVQWLAKQRLRS